MRESLAPYAREMRLDKPIPILLCFFPALYSVTIASHDFLTWLYYTLYCLLGAVVVRSLGCVINDYFDRDLDMQVERTKYRPYASGDLTKRDMHILIAALMCAAVLLLLFLPHKARIVAFIAAPAIAIYPFIKRVSAFAQVFLGFVFQVGALIGWYMVTELFTVVPLVIYIASVLWIIGYDTIYAHQDREYDIKAGVQSMAIMLGDRTADAVWSIYLMMIVLLFVLGLTAGLNLLYLIPFSIVAYHLYWQTQTLDINNPEDCALKFRSNVITGALIFLAIVIGKVF